MIVNRLVRSKNTRRFVGVVGSREVSRSIKRDVEKFVLEKIAKGYGIVTGGATGVDFEAMKIAYNIGGGVHP